MRLIVGLGNPGPRYAETRHNAGWMAVDRLAARCGAHGEVFRADRVEARCGDLLLVKPLLYMNRSGPPVANVLRRTGLPIEHLLVLVDDANLTLGAIRLRRGGSSGGHNGLQSVADALGSEQFARLRMGVGRRPRGLALREYVLGDFGPEEWDAVEPMLDAAAEAALCWASEGAEAAMNRYNRDAPHAQGG